MKTQLAIIVTALMLTPACGGTVSTVGGDASTDTVLPDTSTDAPVDTEEEEAPLTCGDERVPPGGGSFPVVNGSPTFDSTVVDLTDGQALAVGALMQRSGGDWSNMCTATLITPTLVLTAAHCVQGWGGDTPASDFRFAVGNDVSTPIHMWQPTLAVSNPDYSSWGGDADSDIAILELPEPASVAVPTIEPIPFNCIALEASTFMGEDVQNVGYGATETGWDAPDNSTKWWTVEEVIGLTANDFTVDGHGYSSVCYGDSGGPSIWTMPDGVIRVIGTVSWGDPSCMDEDHFARTDDNCTFISDFLTDCGEYDEAGVCEGDTAIWCESGSLTSVDCSATGRLCGDDGTGHNRCIDDPTTCDGLDWEGRCEGDDAMWCDDGEVMVRNCADCLQECGWVEEMSAYYCIDPA